MSGFVKSIIVSLVTIAAFLLLTIYLDGLAGSGGGSAATGDVSPETGEALYWGDGQCSTCHKIGTQGSSTRGPDQEGLYTRAAERAKERGLSSATEYLVESIANPSAYLVEGFGDIMPKVFEPPIVLSRDQILSVILYLQTLGGEPDLAEVTKFKDQIPTASKKKAKPWAPPMAVGPEVGEAIFFSETHEASCSKCHTVKDKGANIGPELTKIAGMQSPEYIMESILNPSAIIVGGFETVYITTTDGFVYTGIVKEKVGDEIVLAIDEDGEMVEIVLYNDEIEEMKQQDVSMMPGNLKELLSVEDFYGVVSYLLTLK